MAIKTCAQSEQTRQLRAWLSSAKIERAIHVVERAPHRTKVRFDVASFGGAGSSQIPNGGT
jgi:hypothetical protein